MAVSSTAVAQRWEQVQHGSHNAMGKRARIHTTAARGGMWRAPVEVAQQNSVHMHVGVSLRGAGWGLGASDSARAAHVRHKSRRRADKALQKKK